MQDLPEESKNIEIYWCRGMNKKIRVWENLSHTRLTQTLEFDPQFERDLTPPGLLRLVISSRVDELPDILRVDIGVRIIEVWMVEDIRELGRERRADPLSHRERLGQAEVVYIQARAYQAAEARVPETARRYICCVQA
jgi:hypothetical protein